MVVLRRPLKNHDTAERAAGWLWGEASRGLQFYPSRTIKASSFLSRDVTDIIDIPRQIPSLAGQLSRTSVQYRKPTVLAGLGDDSYENPRQTPIDKPNDFVMEI